MSACADPRATPWGTLQDRRVGARSSVQCRNERAETCQCRSRSSALGKSRQMIAKVLNVVPVLDTSQLASSSAARICAAERPAARSRPRSSEAFARASVCASVSNCAASAALRSASVRAARSSITISIQRPCSAPVMERGLQLYPYWWDRNRCCFCATAAPGRAPQAPQTGRSRRGLRPLQLQAARHRHFGVLGGLPVWADPKSRVGDGAGVTRRQISQINQSKFRVLTAQ